MIVKLLMPALVGVPEITPVDALNASPAGRAPERLNVSVPLPPDAVTVWLYAVPTMPAGNVAGLTRIAGLTVPE